MAPALSGHLVVQCDHFQGITETQPGPEAWTFLTDHSKGVWYNNKTNTKNKTTTSDNLDTTFIIYPHAEGPGEDNGYEYQ